MSLSYFDEIFFSHFIKQEGDEVLDICHKHIVTIIDTVMVWMFFGAVLPAFLYDQNVMNIQHTFTLNGFRKELLFEAYLFAVYLYLLFKIFDWYNDVWIITAKGIIDLDWKFLKTNVVYIDYNDVKGIEVHQKSSFDGLLNKGEIIIHLQGEGAAFGLSDAKSPGQIVGYIQGVLDDKAKKKKEKEQTLTDRLFSTLRGVIKDHLEKEGIPIPEPEEEIDEEALKEREATERALRKRGTVDLRPPGRNEE